MEDAILSAQQGHRNYAKRQMTWFRREAGVEWLHGFGDVAEITEEAARIIEWNIRPSSESGEI